MKTRETLTVVYKQYTVDVLQDARNYKKRYYVFAASPRDARVLAFALDGGYGQINTVGQGEIALSEVYTTVV